MTKIRIISFFLSLVMAIQMLPVAQIGFALSNNQWTEELPHGTAEDSIKGDCGFSGFLPAAPHNFRFDLSCKAANIYIHTSEQIPTNHSTDIVSPPPDSLA